MPSKQMGAEEGGRDPAGRRTMLGGTSGCCITLAYLL
jgi:hypothetical protein